MLVVILFSGLESALAEVEVGVSTGLTVEYTYAMSATSRSSVNGTLLGVIPYQVTYLETLTVKEISGTNITLESAKTYTVDQSNETNLGWLDLSTGDGPASGCVILPNCNEGDLIYPNFDNITDDLLRVYMINGTILMKDGEANIEVNYANRTVTLDDQIVSMSYYWEKATGLLIKSTFCRTVEVENITQTVCYHYQKIGMPQVFQPLIDNGDYPVTVDSNSTVLGFAVNQSVRQISVYVFDSTGTSGFCDVTVPNELFWGNFSLYSDGFALVEGTDYTQTHNSTHWDFHITYSAGAHLIDIVASNTIPEFPSWIILPAFMVATLAATILYRKKLR